MNKGLYNCLECALSLEPDASLLSQAQSSLTRKSSPPLSYPRSGTQFLSPTPEYEQACTQGGVAVTPLTLTLPNGAAPTATGSSGTHTTAAGSVIGTTAAGTVPAGTVGTVGTVAPVTTAASSNPLSKNGAGAVGTSVASILGVAVVAMAALL